MKKIGFIPARFGSQRFPGKPLAKISGKTLIQRTYENTCLALDSVWVLTDDKKIFDHVLSFGGRAVMTSKKCSNGTERIASCLHLPEFKDAQIVINIQGDEPCIPKDTLLGTIQTLEDNPEADLATAVTTITHEQAQSPHQVKCVRDRFGRALYFSRSPIPYGGKDFLKHLGLYVWRKESLVRFAALEKTPLQIAEDLEQLKAIENQMIIQTYSAKEETPAVDMPDDIKRVENYLCQQNTSSLLGASAPH